MKALDPTASVNGDVKIDIWTRKSDYRPAKIAINVASIDMGTFGMTFDLKYDVAGLGRRSAGRPGRQP